MTALEGRRTEFGWVVYEDSFKSWVKNMTQANRLLWTNSTCFYGERLLIEAFVLEARSAN